MIKNFKPKHNYYIDNEGRTFEINEVDNKLETKEIYSNCKYDKDAKEIYIVGGINSQTEKEITNALAEMPKDEINLFINSPGGSATAGIAIYNLLKKHGKVNTISMALAYSAASLIFCGGKKRQMLTGSALGIHRASGLFWGNQKEMKKLLKTLDVMDENISDIYKEIVSEDKIEKVLKDFDEDTLYSCKEAVACGIATEMVSADKVNKKMKSKIKNELEILDEKAEDKNENEPTKESKKTYLVCPYQLIV